MRGWPTIYILDHEGVIRFKGPRGDAMDEAVDQLLEGIPGNTFDVELRLTEAGD